MFNNNGGYSLSDIAAATGNNGDMFGGGNGAWWIIILFLFCFAGWGGNGFGNNGSTTRDDITYGLNMSNLQSGQTNLANGIANGFYNVNTSLLSGFAGTNNVVNTGISSIREDLCGDQYNLLTALNNVAAVQNQGACDTKYQMGQLFSELNYNLASQNCENRRTTTDGIRDIIEANNANTRTILDFLVKDKLDSLNAENSALRTQISQAEQNAYLVDQLGMKAPQAAYIVANPYVGVSSGCGCGCNGYSYNS